MKVRLDGLDRFVEDTLQIPLRERGALEVLHRLDVFRNLHSLLVLYGCHLPLAQRLANLMIVSEIELRADENDGNAGCVMLDFGIPLNKISFAFIVVMVAMERCIPWLSHCRRRTG